jgi:hypothetical protein
VASSQTYGHSPLYWPGQEGVDALVDLTAQARDLTFADPFHPHGFDQIVDRAGDPYRGGRDVQRGKAEALEMRQPCGLIGEVCLRFRH